MFSTGGPLWPCVHVVSVLDLRGNNASGTLPDQWAALPGLTRLLLSNNTFTGELPPSVWELSALQ